MTRGTADNARVFRNVPIEEVVWFREVEREICPAVGRARTQGHMLRLARECGSTRHLPPKLREALFHACQSEKPIRSVNKLADAVDRDRSALSRQWRKAVGAGSSLRLEDVVDWLLLLRAAGRKVPNRSWPTTAYELGTHEHTFARNAQRLAGLTLRGLEAGGWPVIAGLFTERVLYHLLENERCNILL